MSKRVSKYHNTEHLHRVIPMSTSRGWNNIYKNAQSITLTKKKNKLTTVIMF